MNVEPSTEGAGFTLTEQLRIVVGYAGNGAWNRP